MNTGASRPNYNRMEIQTIEELAEVLQTSGLHLLKVEHEDWSLAIERAAPPPAPAAPIGRATRSGGRTPRAATELLDGPPPSPDLTFVESPVVGVFHETTPAVKVGQRVKTGEVIGSIEALALRNDVRAPIEADVTAVQVEDGQPVEYGQRMFTLARFGSAEADE